MAYVREPLPIMNRAAASKSLWRGPTAVPLQDSRRLLPEPVRRSRRYAARTSARQVGGPLIQPGIDLLSEFGRADQPQRRINQDLGHHRQQLHIVITDERSNAFKIATQIRLEIAKAPLRN